jgi:hypothetical protein
MFYIRIAETSSAVLNCALFFRCQCVPTVPYNYLGFFYSPYKHDYNAAPIAGSHFGLPSNTIWFPSYVSADNNLQNIRSGIPHRYLVNTSWDCNNVINKTHRNVVYIVNVIKSDIF